MNRCEWLHVTCRDNAQGGRGYSESLVHEDFGAGRMIDDEQGEEIEEMGLPELRGDAKVVHAVARGELIAADLDPILGHQRVGRGLRIDA